MSAWRRSACRTTGTSSSGRHGCSVGEPPPGVRTSFERRATCTWPSRPSPMTSCGWTPCRLKSSSTTFAWCTRATIQENRSTHKRNTNCSGSVVAFTAMTHRLTHVARSSFGHSTTTKFGSRPGDVAFSDVRLPDGRPSWLAMDIGAYNHVDPGLAAVDLRSMRIQRQQTLRSERWFDAPDRKEAPVSDFFGLRALESRRDRRVRPRSSGYARTAGVVLPRDGSCRSWAESQAAIAANELTPTTWRRLRAAASPPPPQPALSQRQAAQRHRILLGPGRPPERTHPVLPPPERYRIIRRKEAIKSASESNLKQLMRA